ncbi:hypothetical protein BH11PLA2_BH11PLA2_18470 [soil metagenome]
MPIVTCPVCHEKLELDRKFLGREVECGACQRPFIARDHDSPLPDVEPEVIYTTPITPEDEDDVRYSQRRRKSSVDSAGWGISSLIVGVCGLLMLPISLCCSGGILGTPVASIGMLLGLVGIFTSGEGRGIAIAGTVLNAIVLVICLGVLLYLFANR